MKRLMWLLTFSVLVISGCALRENVIRERGFGELFEIIAVNPTRYTVRLGSNCEESNVVIPPERGKPMFLPGGKVELIVTYYDGDQIIGTWPDKENVSTLSRSQFFEGNFYWWKYTIIDPKFLPQRDNIMK